jgi:hypothetical protein
MALCHAFSDLARPLVGGAELFCSRLEMCGPGSLDRSIGWESLYQCLFRCGTRPDVTTSRSTPVPHRRTSYCTNTIPRTTSENSGLSNIKTSTCQRRGLLPILPLTAGVVQW